MARTIDAILNELNTRSDPQRQTILSQIADIPRQQEAEEAGLKAKLGSAFDTILTNARDRGVGAWGIPMADQAEYAATEFAPAVARVRTASTQRKGSLEDALNQIGSRNYEVAQGIYSQDREYDLRVQQMEEDRRRWEAQMAEARRSAAAQASADARQFQLYDGRNTQGASVERPPLDSFFSTPQPQLRVAPNTVGNVLQPAARTNVQPVYNPQSAGLNTGVSPMLQGAGAISGRLRVR